MAAVAGIDARREAAVRIAAGRFDLDDLSAEIGEQLASIGERISRAQFHDT